MANEESAHTLLVNVSGQDLPADVAGLLAAGYVDNSVNFPDAFGLRFTDNGSGLLDRAGLKIGTPVKLSVQASGGQGPRPLLSGEVTAIEAEMDAAGLHLVVRGFDKSHRLFRGRRVTSYVQMTAADIAGKVAQANGLATGTMDAHGPVLPYVAQDGISDWEFLRRLADDLGAEVAVDDGKLSFRTPANSAHAPSDTASAEQNTLVLERGRNLISLRATVTAADQVPEVEVRGWDVKAKQALVGTSQASTRSAQLADVSPARLAGAVSSRKWVEPVSRFTQQSQCDNRAGAIADRLGGAFAELDGVARGNPDLRAGHAVALGEVGKPFNGRYTLTSTRHDFSPETGYLTHFSVSNASDRSLFGVTAAARADAPGIRGVLSAIVTDAKDPDHLGRVKIKIPVLDDKYESWWARTVQVGAGSGRGWALLPEVGDEVLVAFGQGHIDEPYVLGGLYNGKDKPDQPDHVNGNDGSIQRRALVSRTGMIVELIEKPGEEKLTLSTNGGSQRITLTQKADKAVEIISGGPVTVTAEKDITISTSTGDVSVKGKNITIEASADLKLKATDATIEASANAEMKANAAVKVSGQASAELSAAGQTAVKGAMVMIN